MCVFTVAPDPLWRRGVGASTPSVQSINAKTGEDSGHGPSNLEKVSRTLKRSWRQVLPWETGVALSLSQMHVYV